MERKLRWHERKLQKKTDWVKWKSENNQREVKIIRKYRLLDREDYGKYNGLALSLQKLAHLLSKMDGSDPFRIKMTDQLLEKAYSMGIIPTQKNLQQIAKVSASSFCRRRLAVILVKNKYCENLKQASTYIEHGRLFTFLF
eukprot:TRINITY_DN5644_c0_g1_i2.p1 TRINITY_DN5644_c0_g1~~TRINITY_DN5644_c0_g1_i2.p1  ORF type:complete len:141 (+),score=23.30 TRINITY_DN5644_c0_g1_i2:56-478(+)